MGRVSRLVHMLELCLDVDRGRMRWSYEVKDVIRAYILGAILHRGLWLEQSQSYLGACE